MRDNARLLAEALPAEGIPCSLRWLTREQTSLAGARREVRAWTAELEVALREERPRALLMHYASFAYAHRGIPVFLAPVLRAVRCSGAPLITVMHELAYPLRGGPRGYLWAGSQRAALLALMRASAAAIVTTEQRLEWLRSRRWLPRRPLAFAPVYSSLPPPDPGGPVDELRLGLFGYAYEGANGGLVLDALARLRGRLPVRLQLLGGPGPATATAEAWVREARQRGVEEAISFSGLLPAQQLSDALAGCAVLLCAASPGPTARKSTLAASLASGRPVVAIDGHLTWSELQEQDAARVVAADAGALAEELAALLSNRPAQQALGARGQAFHERRMAPARAAELAAGLIAQVAPASG
jgi:Glycosyl transferases group 1